MSKYDEYRRKRNLLPESSVDNQGNSISKYDQYRMAKGYKTDMRKSEFDNATRRQVDAFSDIANPMNSSLMRGVSGDKAAQRTWEQNSGIQFKPVQGPPAPRQLSEYEKGLQEIEEKRPDGFLGHLYDYTVRPIAWTGNAAFYGNPVGNFVTRAVGTGAETVLGSPSARPGTTGNATADRIADITGTIGGVAGLAFNPAAAGVKGQNLVTGPLEAARGVLSTGAAQKAQRLLSTGINSINPRMTTQTADRLARTGLEGAMTGGIGGVAAGLVQGQDSNQEIARNALLGVGLGAAGDMAISSAGAGLKRLAQRRTPTSIETGPAPDIQPPSRLAPDTPEAPEKFEGELFVRDTPEVPPLLRNEQETEVVSRTSKEQRIRDRLSKVLGETDPTDNKQYPVGQQERGFATTLKASDKTPEEFTSQLDSKYDPITNRETVLKANARIDNDVSDATKYVLGNEKFSADKAVTAQRLIDHYNQQKNYQMAVAIADKVASEATKAGQAIQALSVYNRLTPEGVLIHAKQIAKKVNENIPVNAKKVEITNEMAANLTDLAATTQKMTGVKNLSNTVIDILERAKSGEKLDSTEVDQLNRFVQESKQFIKESTKKSKPRPPRPLKEMKDKRVRDNVMSFLDAQEQAAKERLRARGIRISSTPLDVWADYAVIGAAKMAKGVVKFADWSAEMVKELGEDVRPTLESLYNKSRETFEMSAKKISQDTISKAERLTEKLIKTKNLSESEAESLLTLARRVSGLSGEEKRIASQDLQYILQQLDRPGILKKISSTQTIMQLLNPKTQIRNVFGNELFYRIERLNKYLATPLDIARSKITGTDRKITFKTHNQGQFWQNWFEGVKAGWKGVNINGLETQFDLHGAAFKGKYNPMTYLEKSLGAALRGFDNAAYMRAYNKTMGEIGTLDAINRGIKPTKQYVQDFILKADDNIKQIADQYGRYVTFQDNNVISVGLTKLKRGLNVGKDFGFGDLVLKYPKTPGALLMRALEYSPAGFVRSAVIIAKGIRNAEKDPAEAVLALSRAITGTVGFAGMGYFLMDKGVITGVASKDRDVRSLQQAAGQGQYQVNISALTRWVDSGFDQDAIKLKEGDFLYTYDWLQPVSISLSMGANVNKNIKEGKEAESIASGAIGSAVNSFAGGINTLTEQSVLSGVQSAFSSYPGQSVTDKIIDILSDVPSSFVPTLFNQIKQAQDNKRRETYSPNKIDQSLNKAQAKIPGLAQKLPVQYDSLGQAKKHYQDGNLFNIFLNPGFASRYDLSPEAKLIVDLITETGDETLAPRVPQKTVKGIKLTGEQFSRLQQIQGEETAKRIRNMPSGDAETKAKYMEKALTEAGKVAREQIMKEFNLSSK